MGTMGHHASKDRYLELARRLDGSTVRTPDHAALQQILEELYRPEDAELVARMPWRLCRAERIALATGLDVGVLLPKLDALADQGLVLDLAKESTGERFYIPSPFVIGIFEFTMMRAGPEADHARRAALFHDYFERGDFFHANLGNGQRVFLARALPHWDGEQPSTEILSVDRADLVIEQARRFALGVCSCRHQREHLGERHCTTPLETCTAMDSSADYLIRHGMAQPIERSQMREIVARSRNTGLVMCADNVANRVSFICHCCTCCCHMVRGITERGYPNAVTSAPYVPSVDEASCNGCGRCVSACPVRALTVANDSKSSRPGAARPALDVERCLGCGVCVTRCHHGALRLRRSGKRRILPENTFERAILQCLERGNLQNLIFDEQGPRTHRTLRAVLGGFLRVPSVKRLLFSEALRSRFLRGLVAVSGYDGP